MKALGYILWTVASLLVAVNTAILWFTERPYWLKGYPEGEEYYEWEESFVDVSIFSISDLTDPERLSVRDMKYASLADGSERVFSTIAPSWGVLNPSDTALLTIWEGQEKLVALSTSCFMPSGTNVIISDLAGGNVQRVLSDPALLLDYSLLLDEDAALLVASYVPIDPDEEVVSCQNGVVISAYDLLAGRQVFERHTSGQSFQTVMWLSGGMLSANYESDAGNTLSVLNIKSGELRDLSERDLNMTEN